MEGEVSPVTPEELADIRARDSEDFPPGSSCSVSEALEAICDRHLLLAEIDRLSSEREYLVEVRHTDGGTIDEILLHESGGERCLFHMERMDDDLWWFAMYTRRLARSGTTSISSARRRTCSSWSGEVQKRCLSCSASSSSSSSS